MKYAIVDLETTGLNPYKHEIIEIGAVIFNPENLNTTIEVNVKVKPEGTCDPKAALVNGYTDEKWIDAKPIKDVLKELAPKWQGAVFMAYNNTFDWSFMQAAYQKIGVHDPFHYHRLDIMTIAWSHLPVGSSLSLKNVCTALGIPPEPAVHRAINGALSAFEVYKALRK